MKVGLSMWSLGAASPTLQWHGLPPSCQVDFTEGHQDHHRIRLINGDLAMARHAFGALRIVLNNYAIFPPHRLSSAFCIEGGMKIGQTMVQRVRIGPLYLEMANRIVDVFDRQDGAIRRFGFTLVTVVGHPEQGVETVSVVSYEGNGSLDFCMDSYSRPGHWLTRSMPGLVRRFQLYAVGECLTHVRQCAWR